MDVDKQLAKGQLLDPDLNHTVGILAHGELVEGLVALNQLTADAVVHLCVLLLSVHGLLLHLLVWPGVSLAVLTHVVTIFACRLAQGVAIHVLLHILVWWHDDIVTGATKGFLFFTIV